MQPALQSNMAPSTAHVWYCSPPPQEALLPLRLQASVSIILYKFHLSSGETLCMWSYICFLLLSFAWRSASPASYLPWRIALAPVRRVVGFFLVPRAQVHGTVLSSWAWGRVAAEASPVAPPPSGYFAALLGLSMRLLIASSGPWLAAVAVGCRVPLPLHGMLQLCVLLLAMSSNAEVCSQLDAPSGGARAQARRQASPAAGCAGRSAGCPATDMRQAMHESQRSMHRCPPALKARLQSPPPWAGRRCWVTSMAASPLRWPGRRQPRSTPRSPPWGQRRSAGPSWPSFAPSSAGCCPWRCTLRRRARYTWHSWRASASVAGPSRAAGCMTRTFTCTARCPRWACCMGRCWPCAPPGARGRRRRWCMLSDTLSGARGWSCSEWSEERMN